MLDSSYIRRIKEGSKTYLKPDEVVSRVVAAQTVSQVLLLLPMAVMVVGFILARIYFHGSKDFVVAGLVVLFLLFLFIANKVEYRYAIVSDQGVTLVDGGYFGTDPGARLIGRFPGEAASNIPTKKLKRFDVLGERLYVRYSIVAEGTAS
ncbi:MAG: hypothetical protein ABSG24_05940 [Acidimicrobiales bacterium]|jgi:hypothetical protein